MSEEGERLARIEEGQKYILEDIRTILAHVEGISTITQCNCLDISMLQNDNKWRYAIVAATGSVILSVVGYLIK